MRIFVSVLGGLFLLVALLAGLASAVVLSEADSDGSVTCTNSSTSSYCNGDASGDTQYQAVGIAMAVGAAGLFVGGCALIGGAVAGSGRKPAAPTYAAPPQVSSGPPTYGS